MKKNSVSRYFTSQAPSSQELSSKVSTIPNAQKCTDPKLLTKFSRGENLLDYVEIKSNFKRAKQLQREKKIFFANRTAAHAEILLTEKEGFIEFDDDDLTFGVNQEDITKNVDISTANKFFNLKLPKYGPYTIDYSKNGRYLLLGGTKGHLAAFEWHAKLLKFEINVGEAIHCVRWLHTENMVAVGQKRWVHIYDNQGIELHCLKMLYDVRAMQFLSYHFLLCSGNGKGFLTWFDVSIGKIVTHLYTGLGRSTCTAMTQNPQNAVIYLGGHDGCVTFWTPNSVPTNSQNSSNKSNEDDNVDETKGILPYAAAVAQNYSCNISKPIIKMWCHRHPIRCISIDPRGMYMATCDTDKNLHLWDLKSYKIIDAFRLTGLPNRLTFSQTQLLAVSIGSRVEIYKDLFSLTTNDITNKTTSPQHRGKPYLTHKLFDPNTQISDLQFCPYEDVLGIGHTSGFTSIIVPGAGEANIDSYEANPFQTVSQRKEMEVKALLGKIQPELISLDTGNINRVNVPSLQEKLEQRNKIISLKPKKIDIKVRKRKGKKGASARRINARKQEILLNKKKEYYQDLEELEQIEKAADVMLQDSFTKIERSRGNKKKKLKSKTHSEGNPQNINLIEEIIIPQALDRFLSNKIKHD